MLIYIFIQMTELLGSQIFEMISLIFSMSHFGVEVAPQIPTDVLFANHVLSSSSGEETKCVSGLMFLQTE